jgi:hypothetical protein
MVWYSEKKGPCKGAVEAEHDVCPLVSRMSVSTDDHINYWVNPLGPCVRRSTRSVSNLVEIALVAHSHMVSACIFSRSKGAHSSLSVLLGKTFVSCMLLQAYAHLIIYTYSYKAFASMLYHDLVVVLLSARFTA